MADPGSVFAGHQHAASGTSGGHHHGRSRERADGVEADAGSGRGSAPVSSGTIERRLCLSVSGRSELAGAAAGGTQASTDAGGVRDSARWQPSLAGFLARWDRSYPGMVRRLQQDLPELLSFFAFPRHLWRKLRTTNVIERCFVEVRRRTRPMVCFVNVESVDRISYSIFQRFNLEWKTRTLSVFTQAA